MLTNTGLPVVTSAALARGESGRVPISACKQGGTDFPGATSKRRPPAIKTVSKCTRPCRYHLTGTCERSAQRSFAHGLEELQEMPNLRKTRMYSRFRLAGKCCQDAEYKFAHDVGELRQMPSTLDRPKICKQQDVPPFAKGRTPALPTSEAYFRSGMSPDSNSDDDYDADDDHDDNDDDSDENGNDDGAFADGDYYTDWHPWQQQQQLLRQHWQQQKSQQHTRVHDCFIEQFLMQATQFLEQSQYSSCRTKATPESCTLLDTTLADSSFNGAPSAHAGSKSEDGTSSRKEAIGGGRFLTISHTST